MQQALQAMLVTQHAQQQDVSPALVSYAQTLLEAFERKQCGDPTEKTIPLVSTTRVHPLSQDASLPIEPLTQREQEVLLLLADGASNQDIANQLVVSLATAKKHVASILSKLGAENRTQAIARARSHFLL